MRPSTLAKRPADEAVENLDKKSYAELFIILKDQLPRFKGKARVSRLRIMQETLRYIDKLQQIAMINCDEEPRHDEEPRQDNAKLSRIVILKECITYIRELEREIVLQQKLFKESELARSA